MVAFVGHFFGISPLKVLKWAIKDIGIWHNEAILLYNKLNPSE